MEKKDRALISRINGKKGGRPKQDSTIRIELPEIDLVILTPTQYGSLLEKYGYELLIKSLKILPFQPQEGHQREISASMLEKELLFCFLKRQWGLNEGRESTIQEQQMWSNSVQRLPATYRSFF